MRKLVVLLAAVVVLAGVACQSNDDEVLDAIEDLQEQVAAVEATQAELLSMVEQMQLDNERDGEDSDEFGEALFGMLLWILSSMDPTGGNGMEESDWGDLAEFWDQFGQDFENGE